MSPLITPALHQLRDAFVRHGHDIRLVGGAVRCVLRDEQPVDIDLCTDATPDEQEAIYQAEHLRHFPTGIKHGTWTVMLRDRRVVEITTLRTETVHGVMTWTRDWQEDLARRDLTINAMAMTFDGTIIDPFGGKPDLEQGIVRFVGDPSQRIREDYLRILRFFRFHAKIAGDRTHDSVTIGAIKDNLQGLCGIARERVWSEIAKITVGRYGVSTIGNIVALGIAPYIDLPARDIQTTRLRPREYQRVDPASVMAAYLGTPHAVQTQARVWRWSADERHQASFIADVLANRADLTLAEAQKLTARGVFKHWLIEALCLLDQPAEADALLRWSVPDFPVFGRDLLVAGLQQGEEIGSLLRALRQLWEESEYRLNRQALVELLPTVRRT
jgi:tRNA nucleotidyltransferase (CCA-adding enzyme)